MYKIIKKFLREIIYFLAFFGKDLINKFKDYLFKLKWYNKRQRLINLYFWTPLFVFF